MAEEKGSRRLQEINDEIEALKAERERISDQNSILYRLRRLGLKCEHSPCGNIQVAGGDDANPEGYAAALELVAMVEDLQVKPSKEFPGAWTHTIGRGRPGLNARLAALVRRGFSWLGLVD